MYLLEDLHRLVIIGNSKEVLVAFNGRHLGPGMSNGIESRLELSCSLVSYAVYILKGYHVTCKARISSWDPWL